MRIIAIMMVVSLSACGTQPSVTGESPGAESFATSWQTEDQRLDELEAGGKRARANILEEVAASNAGEKIPENSSGKWIVNAQFSGCPKASDWYATLDAVQSGNLQAELPTSCFKVPPGTIVRAGPHGKRPKTIYHGHKFEQGYLQDGTGFWSDGMDDVTLSRVP